MGRPYIVEMRCGEPVRHVHADDCVVGDDWTIFYTLPPQGGRKQLWRVCTADIVSIGGDLHHPQATPKMKGMEDGR